MIQALKPGGALLSVEPDMTPCTMTEPDSMRRFWQGWLKWSVDAKIDYFIGREVPAWLDSFGLLDVAGEGHTAWFNGGSDWANYWKSTIQELAPALIRSKHVTEPMLETIRTHTIGPASSRSRRTGGENRDNWPQRCAPTILARNALAGFTPQPFRLHLHDAVLRGRPFSCLSYPEEVDVFAFGL